jgi:hypothetical protein
MQVLFINSKMSLENIAKKILSALGISKMVEGDSSFSPKGYYFKCTVLGIDLKIDENNYDYEDNYNYMISIKKTIGTKLADDNALLGFAEIIASLISSKLGIDIALEMETRRNEKLNLKVFSFDGEKVNANLINSLL